MPNDLHTLCLENMPHYLTRTLAIRQADKGDILACIANSDCQSWFLDDVLRNYPANDDDLVKQILQHGNCPKRVLIFVKLFQPDWVENTSVMAEIRLALMGEDMRMEWAMLKYDNKAEDLEEALETLYSLDIKMWSRNLGAPDKYNPKLDWDGNKVVGMTELLKRAPAFLIRAFCDHKESQPTFARYLNWDELRPLLLNMEPKIRAIAATRDDLASDLVASLSADSSVLVRSAIANNPLTDEQTLLSLAGDKSSKVAQAALNNLPGEIRNRLLQKDVAPQKLEAHDDVGSLLLTLRLPTVDPAILAGIAERSSAVIACAATLHPATTQTALDAVSRREDFPEWALLGVALKTNDVSVIDLLLKSQSKSIQIGLSGNPHLSKEQALKLLKNTKEERVRANVANLFIDDAELLQQIAATAQTGSNWLTLLKLVLDAASGPKDLKTVFENSKFRYLVLTRLVARHPNCPPDLYRTFVYYLPEDLALNPTYALKVLETGQPAKPRYLDPYIVSEYWNRGNAPEYLCRWTWRSGDLVEMRKVISSYHADPNLVRHTVIMDDVHVHKRFLHENSIRFGEYEYQVLALVGNTAVKKLLLDKSDVSDELVISLAQSPDKAVAMAAQKLAQERKLGVTVKIDKSSKKSLGNKAARLDLAKSTQDVDLLKVLAADPVRDVRYEVAGRDEASLDILIQFLDDADDLVLQQSIHNLERRNVGPDQHERMQSIYRRIFLDEGRKDQTREMVLRYIDDIAFAEHLFAEGEGKFDSAILRKTGSMPILDKALFELARGNNKINAWVLYENQNLTPQHMDTLIMQKPRDLEYLLKYAASARRLLYLMDRHPEMLKRNTDSLRYSNKFSPADVLALFKELDADTFIPLVRGSLHRLADEDLIPMLSSLSTAERFISVIANTRYSTEVKKAIFNIVENSKNRKWIAEYSYSFPLDEKTIDRYLAICSKGIQRAIAHSQTLTDRQLLVLCECQDDDVRGSLLEPRNAARLPVAYVRGIARSTSHYCAEARAELLRRGISLDDLDPLSATVILKKFDVDLSVIKFNELMLAKGLIDVVSRESSSKPGKFKESKKLSETGSRYGNNKEDSQGDYIIVYFPDTFSELLVEIGIRQ